MENIGDAILLSSLRQGSEEALSTLYEKYSHQVRLYVTSKLSNPQEAEDVVQEVFMYLWVKRAKLPEIKDWRFYLIKAAHNRALNKIDKKKTDQSREKKYFQNAPLFDDPTATNYSLVEQLIPALDKYLSPTRADALRKVYLEGRKQQEVAKEMGITVPALRGIIVSSTKKLKEILKK
ncbi:RNA polymerase sigma factor [Chitinophaga rhizophila]|uniref:RNA polymerase sigma factor n=1 Tax=Chitinophaga rhizophila TaxID=2866212 RepID=A0ABS7GI22_9BACT|nr:RNA polymerase sigma factor [Chitinophaga rhizophila]MBW8686795.1 RNA polymerase sigma factor [Chitinophaga rhizophila]